MENVIKFNYNINRDYTVEIVEPLTNRDRRIINTMFNHLISNKRKVDIILEYAPQYRNEIIKSRRNPIVVNEIIDEILDYSEKLDIISVFYEFLGYEFNSKELIKYRDIIKINKYDFNWKNRTERKLCYKYA